MLLIDFSNLIKSLSHLNAIFMLRKIGHFLLNGGWGVVATLASKLLLYNYRAQTVA